VPAKYMNAFSFEVHVSNASNRTVHVFDWSNDPAEDTAFAAYIAAALPWAAPGYEARNVVVNRSGATPQASWENWYLSGGTWHFGSSGAAPLSTGSAHYRAGNEVLGVFDPTGYWDSDQYGRPFDLNDLLA
jgi:hypothetical protein